VLGAKTQVCIRADGGADFDLTIVVDGSQPAETIDYHAQLGRFLRRSEFPRTLRVVAEGGAFCYK